MENLPAAIFIARSGYVDPAINWKYPHVLSVQLYLLKQSWVCGSLTNIVMHWRISQ